MESVVVQRPVQETVDGRARISATIDVAGRRFDIYFGANEGALTEQADPFLAVALLPAMRLSLPLVIHGEASPLLLERVEQIQHIFCRWFDDFHHVSITVDEQAPPGLPGAATGSFFTGGIDSFYTVLKHQDSISKLLFVHGFDVPLDRPKRRQLVSGDLRQAAAEMGKSLLEVETNIRSILDVYTEWNVHSHGAALCAVALAVAPQFRRLYQGSTHSYDSLRILGSHEILNYRWSTENLEIVLDGGECSRWEKAEKIISHDVVQRHLRSCWQIDHEGLNCGVCRTCRLAMIFLRAVGVQGTTYPPLLDLDLVRQAVIDANLTRMGAEHSLAIAERRGSDPELIAALRERLAQPDVQSITPDGWAQAAKARSRVVILEMEQSRLFGRIAELEAWATKQAALIDSLQAAMAKVVGKAGRSPAAARSAELEDLRTKQQAARSAALESRASPEEWPGIPPARVAEREARTESQAARIADLDAQLARLPSSLSWRVTAPLRRAAAALRSLSARRSP